MRQANERQGGPRPTYTTVVVHQFDPDTPAPGGVDVCIRGLLRNASPNERILVIGASARRPLFRLHQVQVQDRVVDFVAVSRVDTANQRRLIPHSLRMAFGAWIPFLRLSCREAVVHTHRLELGALFSILPARRRVLFVHTDRTKAVGPRSDSFWRFTPGIFRWLETRTLDRVDLCVVFSRPSAVSMEASGVPTLRSTTWYDERLFYSADSPRDLDVVWVGRLEEPKDPILAIRAIQRYLASEPSGSAAVVGDGTLRGAVERAIGETKNIALLCPLPQEGVAAVFRRARVLLMTSHFEGSPIVLSEAMASGTAVVAVAEADPDGTVDDGVNGIVVRNREPQSLADAIAAAQRLAGGGPLGTARRLSSGVVASRIWKRIALLGDGDGDGDGCRNDEI